VTLKDIEHMDCPTINAAIAALVLHCDPQDLRDQAQSAPQFLGFPVIVHGHRVKIPRLPFIQFIKGGTP
jgi:hypothetical protein